jgi:hypothetical protein
MLIPLPKELFKPCYMHHEGWRRKFNVDVLRFILIKDDARDRATLDSRKVRFAYQMGFTDGGFKKLNIQYSKMVMDAADEYLLANPTEGTE